MPDPGSSRLEDLQMRWQQDPGSRVYLQLAEEYRKLDRHPEAVEVLQRGLEQRPNDLSGQVALGRCHLEMKEIEPALELLEGVIERDPAHIVANKLLLEAYLETGDAASAGERLELCKLLNPVDPELEELETKLRGLRGPARPEPEAPSPSTPGPSAPGPSAPEPVGVTTAEIPIVPRDEDEVLAPMDLEETPAEDVFEASSEPDPAFDSFLTDSTVDDVPTKPVLEPVVEPTAEETPARDPAFETTPALGLGTTEEGEPPAPEPAQEDDSAFELVAEPEEEPAEPETATREAAAPEGVIFDLGPPPPPPRLEELWGWPAAEMAADAVAQDVAQEPETEEPAAPAPAPEEEPEKKETPELVAEPVAPEPEPEPAAPEPPPAAPEPPVPEPPPAAPEPAAPVEEPVTATLGELYLRQGHPEEAERIFRQVLRRDSRNAAALAGLARIRGEEGLTAQDLLASAGERIPVGLTAKKTRLLESYLKQLRRGEAHVR